MDSRPETQQHINRVQDFMRIVIDDLAYRGVKHDQSKLISPEVEYFDRLKVKLADVEYMSPAYKAGLDELRPAIDHHYEVNDHHPQHYPNGIQGMDLMAVLEMFCDWRAAGERNNGTIYDSIEKNQGRFGYSDELKQIFINTANSLERLCPSPSVPPAAPTKWPAKDAPTGTTSVSTQLVSTRGLRTRLQKLSPASFYRLLFGPKAEKDTSSPASARRTSTTDLSSLRHLQVPSSCSHHTS